MSGRLLPAGRLQPDAIVQQQRPAPQYASGWFSNRGWSAPPPAFGANRSFGMWDGLFLGALLSNLGCAGSGEFFHNNQNDPCYQQWRQEANQQAQGNPDLRAKLHELDCQSSERDGEPRTPGVPGGGIAFLAYQRRPSANEPFGGQPCTRP